MADAENGTVVIEGYLAKQGLRTSGWKRRFCRLRLRRDADGETRTPWFEYAVDAGSHEKGVVPLTAGAAADVCPSHEHAFLLCARWDNTGRVFVLAADSDEERDRWVHALRSSRSPALGGVTQGAVQKQSDYLRQWRRRYFVVFANLLMYYKVPGGQYRDTFDLRGFTVRTTGVEPPLFMLRGPSRTYHIRAADTADVSRWAQAFMQASAFRVPTRAEEESERADLLCLTPLPSAASTPAPTERRRLSRIENGSPWAGAASTRADSADEEAGDGATSDGGGDSADERALDGSARAVQRAWRQRQRQRREAERRQRAREEAEEEREREALDAAARVVAARWRRYRRQRDVRSARLGAIGMEVMRLTRTLRHGLSVRKFDRRGRAKRTTLSLNVASDALVWNSKKAEEVGCADVLSASREATAFPFAKKLSRDERTRCAVITTSGRALSLLFYTVADRELLLRYLDLRKITGRRISVPRSALPTGADPAPGAAAAAQ